MKLLRANLGLFYTADIQISSLIILCILQLKQQVFGEVQNGDAHASPAPKVGIVSKRQDPGLPDVWFQR